MKFSLQIPKWEMALFFLMAFILLFVGTSTKPEPSSPFYGLFSGGLSCAQGWEESRNEADPKRSGNTISCFKGELRSVQNTGGYFEVFNTETLERWLGDEAREKLQ